MYADEMQTQMDYEAQMAEQEMYESQMYADMQQESASYTQADVHDSDWHIADDMEEDAEDEDVVSDGSATAVSDAGNEQDRKSTRLNSSHQPQSRMPSSA